MDAQRQQDQAHEPSLPLPRRVVLGVCASIAAYKAPLVVRELVKRGVEVRVVMTPAARRFVSPLVLENLSRSPVVWAMFDRAGQHDGSWHIALSRWCEAMLIAPCSAATLSRLASGQSDSALTLVALALPHPIPLFLAPAMDTDMWEHPATRRNLELLKGDGAHIIEPDHGELASGLVGAGRLPEPARLVEALLLNGPLSGTTVLVTAGPTRERLDDVRYLSNDSSGKMGYALASEARRLGARVVLVSGPVSIASPVGVEVVAVESAQEMYDAVLSRREAVDVFVMAAAVADFRPVQRHRGKLKKEAGMETVELERTADILAEVGRTKRPDQLVVGFALEAANHEENAKRKMTQKNCDLLVLNAANRPDSGFAVDSNTITLFRPGREPEACPPMPKPACARLIFRQILQNRKNVP